MRATLLSSTFLFGTLSFTSYLHAASQEVLIANVRGIMLVDSVQNVVRDAELEEANGIKLIGVNVPGNPAELKQLLSPFLDKPVTWETIQQIKTNIQTFYRYQGHPFVVVAIPEQEVTSGVLQMVVSESTIGNIYVQGNRWSSERILRRDLRLKSGDKIDHKQIEKSINFINSNPLRKVDIIYSAGKSAGTTDLTMAVQEENQIRGYVGADNTGVKTVGRNRFFAGFTWANAFNQDHVFTYQFTGGFDFNKFQAQTATYHVPLPWQHYLDLVGSYSTVKVRPVPMLCSKGKSSQASLRYKIPFHISTTLFEEAIVGFDFKRTNNTIEFIENTPRIASNVNLTQLVFGYAGRNEGNSYYLDFDGNLFWSPGRWISDQSERNFNSLRVGAKDHWVYVRGDLTYLQRLHYGFFNCIFSGQLASTPLLPSEQFGLGGHNTVRGYEERAFSADNGVLVNVEWRTPGYSIIGRKKPSIRDSLQALVFIDYGYGHNKRYEAFEGTNAYLLGAGPGLRYNIGSNLTARLDLGFRLHNSKIFTGPDQLVYFSVIGSY